MDRIDARVAELSARLRGPRRARVDLLTEARDGMVDAAESYRRAGLSAAAAERRAVEEFGEPAELVGAYQAELGLAAGRHAAVLVFLVLAAQPLVWSGAVSLMTAGQQAAPAAIYTVANLAANWAGGTSMALALLAALACGLGARHLGARRWPAVFAGVLACAVCVVFLTVGVLLTAFNPLVPVLPLGLPLMLVLLVGPLAWVAVAARQCLTAA